MKYQRLVEIYVKPDLREKIKILKGGKTSDEFLRNLIKKETLTPGEPRPMNSMAKPYHPKEQGRKEKLFMEYLTRKRLLKNLY